MARKIFAEKCLAPCSGGTVFGAPDRGDQHLWDLLAAQRRAILVTDDRRLLESPPHETRVTSPGAFARQHLPPARRSGS